MEGRFSGSRQPIKGGHLSWGLIKVEGKVVPALFLN
jgi:hypothetical protein